MLTTLSGGNAKDPKFSVPQDSEFLDLKGGEQQPVDWLGEGFAVKMDTKARNTPSADWRFVVSTVAGSRDVFFVQNKYKMGVKNLSAIDVQERFLALQAEFVRYGVHANIPLEKNLSMAQLSCHNAAIFHSRCTHKHVDVTFLARSCIVAL